MYKKQKFMMLCLRV